MGRPPAAPTHEKATPRCKGSGCPGVPLLPATATRHHGQQPPQRSGALTILRPLAAPAKAGRNNTIGHVSITTSKDEKPSKEKTRCLKVNIHFL